MAHPIGGRPMAAYRRRFLLLVPVLLVMTSCGEVISGPTKLSGTLWKLDSLRTPAGVASVVNPELYNLQFTETLDHHRTARLYEGALRAGQPRRRLREAPGNGEALQRRGRGADPRLGQW